jgi:hypothetical protein
MVEDKDGQMADWLLSQLSDMALCREYYVVLHMRHYVVTPVLLHWPP